MDTFSSLAESQTMLDAAGADVHLPQTTLSDYTVLASALPRTSVLQVSVLGPDPRRSARLADAMIGELSKASTRYFRVFEFAPLDSAAVPTQPGRQQRSSIWLVAALAGAIAGFAIAALSLHTTATAAGPLRPWNGA